MDPDINIVHASGKGELPTEAQMRVCVASQYNRKCLTTGYENKILEIWKERLAGNSSLFNGTKFRFHSLITDANDRPLLNLGVTCYRDFIGTNWSPQAQQLRDLGRTCHNNQQSYMSDPLGVGACVISSDNYMIFLKRGRHLAEAPGMWDVPGGHPEPKELLGDVPVEEIIPETMDPENVVHEIYDSTIREIVDEVNIPSSCLSCLCFMGVATNNQSAGRASAEFLVRCSLLSSEIQELYMAGDQSEAEESTNINFVSEKDVLNMEREPGSIWHHMAPSGKGCVKLYCLHREQNVQ